MVAPRRAGEQEVQPAGSASRPKWRRATASLWSSRSGSGSASQRAAAPGSAGVEPAEAERRELARHREVADRDRAAVQRRLDQRQAEALPRRRQDDDVARGVGGGHRDAGRQPRRTGYAGRLRPERSSSAANPSSAGPVSQNVPPSAAASASPTSTFLRAMARVGCSTSGRSAVTPSAGADLRPPPRAGPLVEPVVDGGGGDPAPLRERPAGLLVDRHVPPRRVVGRPRREIGVLLALPRQVVVAQHGGPPAQVVRHRLPDRAGSSAASRRCRRPRGRRRRARGRARGATAGAGTASTRDPRPARRPGRRPPPSSRACPAGAGRAAHCAAVTETPSAMPSR